MACESGYNLEVEGAAQLLEGPGCELELLGHLEPFDRQALDSGLPSVTVSLNISSTWVTKEKD